MGAVSCSASRLWRSRRTWPAASQPLRAGGRAPPPSAPRSSPGRKTGTEFRWQAQELVSQFCVSDHTIAGGGVTLGEDPFLRVPDRGHRVDEVLERRCLPQQPAWSSHNGSGGGDAAVTSNSDTRSASAAAAWQPAELFITMGRSMVGKGNHLHGAADQDRDRQRWQEHVRDDGGAAGRLARPSLAVAVATSSLARLCIATQLFGLAQVGFAAGRKHHSRSTAAASAAAAPPPQHRHRSTAAAQPQHRRQRRNGQPSAARRAVAMAVASPPSGGAGHDGVASGGRGAAVSAHSDSGRAQMQTSEPPRPAGVGGNGKAADGRTRRRPAVRAPVEIPGGTTHWETPAEARGNRPTGKRPRGQEAKRPTGQEARGQEAKRQEAKRPTGKRPRGKRPRGKRPRGQEAKRPRGQEKQQ